RGSLLQSGPSVSRERARGRPPSVQYGLYRPRRFRAASRLVHFRRKGALSRIGRRRKLLRDAEPARRQGLCAARGRSRRRRPPAVQPGVRTDGPARSDLPQLPADAGRRRWSSVMTVYVPDTAFFVEAARRGFPLLDGSPFWESLARLAAQGRLQVIDKVQAELDR